MNQEVIFTNHVAQTLDAAVEKMNPANIVVIVDSNTATFVLPRMQTESMAVGKATVITTKAGDMHKGLESLSHIWEEMCKNGCTRGTLVINLGGGVITDMGAFAAATFKRGVRFINIPTTLLSGVDAAIGGKTGINFNGLKNEIGLFREADLVIISTTFFNTLTDVELLSGYAEMLKHSLISSKEEYDKLLNYDVTSHTWDQLLDLLQESVLVKSRIVQEDPTENGVRRALNFGHTAGHAFEEFSFERKSPIPHGYAVAFGMIVELVLSNMKVGFPSAELNRFSSYIKEHYGEFSISCRDYDRIIELMRHDKKNTSPDAINFTLLSAVGEFEINSTASPDEIKAALDIYRDLLGL